MHFKTTACSFWLFIRPLCCWQSLCCYTKSHTIYIWYTIESVCCPIHVYDDILDRQTASALNGDKLHNTCSSQSSRLLSGCSVGTTLGWVMVAVSVDTRHAREVFHRLGVPVYSCFVFRIKCWLEMVNEMNQQVVYVLREQYIRCL